MITSTPSPQSPSASFPTGTRLVRARRILPLFLPFAGCPGKCIFCAQDRQTGSPATRSLDKTISAMDESLSALPATESPSLELAFYGGTFTALPQNVMLQCLEMFQRHQARGVLSHARCSTRPDALPAETLDQMRTRGLTMVELGIQSFNAHALSASRRGYTPEIALQGCRAVQEAGLDLGVQLLPGMPGVSPAVFLADVEAALALHPAALRFYPCLVPEGTPLATAWQNGNYQPWSLEMTIQTLGEALWMAWKAEIPVIRLAVAPEADFDRSVLAGPRHPALGSLIRATALQCAVNDALARLGRPPQVLYLPRSCQGYMYGDRGNLKDWWAARGFSPANIVFTSDLAGKLT